MFTPVTAPLFLLGECPVWLPGEGRLAFLDIPGKGFHRLDPVSGALESVDLPENPGCFAPCKQGGFVIALRSGIFRMNGKGELGERLAAFPEDPRVSRFNDGVVDPKGRLILGTIDEGKPKTSLAHLYRFDRNGLAVLRSGLITANGAGFSRDGRTFYHADTPRFGVHAYDYDVETGSISNERLFAMLDSTSPDQGRPDGAAVDDEGGYWVALYEGGRVQRYAPDGRLIAEYPVPARCVTMPTFGGPDGKTLYVTTAKDGRPAEELARLPHAGAVFAMRVDVAGHPRPAFDLEA